MGASVWLIGGPTASGKSTLALRLAEALGGEVVNADALQLYADLRVLSARPSPAEEARAPHHLYGVADAAEAWSAGRWLRAVELVLTEVAGRGRPAVVVGGTGLYLRALTEGLAEVPPVPAAVREETAAAFDRLGEAAFRARLGERDPAAAARIAPGDRQRLIRAASVAAATGQPLSQWQATPAAAPPAGRQAAVVLEPPRQALYARCDARTAAMLVGGGVEEARALLARGLPPDVPAMKAIGVRELGELGAGGRDRALALAAVQQQTRRYAKRQSTWFRNQAPGWLRIAAADPDAQWQALSALAAAQRA